MNSIRKALIAASALTAVAIPAQASAASFILNGLGSISNTSARNGFKAAANYWSSVLKDDATIIINVGFSTLAPNVLGQASSSTYRDATANIVGQLAADGTSALDAQAVASLAPVIASGLTEFWKSGYVNDANQTGIDSTKRIFDNDGSANNQQMRANAATLKALGYTGFGSNADATITFNSAFNFDFDARDGIRAGSYDFVGVAVHEIGHALGFTSSVDYYDIRSCPSSPNCASQQGLNFNTNLFAGVSTSDLFRYSSAGARDISVGTETYFSVNGGVSEVYGNANFSTGRFGGDGEQASHWKSPETCRQSDFIGIMNPYLCSGMTAVVKAQDIALLDAVGWDVADGARDNGAYAFSSAEIRAGFVPEPAVWMQLILGFGVIGGAYRSQRRKVAFSAA